MRVIKIVLLILFSFLTNEGIFAEVVQVQSPVSSITQPQNIEYIDCTKMYAVNKENLFYLTLSSITANKFGIEEIQTNNGYIIFTVANNRYLATIAGIDANNSILKITPCNNIYFFPPGILINLYKHIEINLHTELR